jgi:peroxiredoxin
LLSAKQRDRLEAIRLQAQGWPALQRPEIAARLQLTAVQQKRIASLLQDFQSRRQALQQRAAAGEQKLAALQGELERLKSLEHERIVRVLTSAQQKTWLDLIGRQYDFSNMIQIAATAPELRGVTEWINSPPIQLSEQRGKVVVVHFFAANCINCIRNYPHYRKWDETFSKTDVVIVGIHTPETKAERDIERIRRKFAEHELNFPIAIDQEKTNWDAWTNRMWPSVYLIDKQGRIRNWWYGELEWNNAGGEQWMRERIEALIAEDAGER